MAPREGKPATRQRTSLAALPSDVDVPSCVADSVLRGPIWFPSASGSRGFGSVACCGGDMLAYPLKTPIRYNCQVRLRKTSGKGPQIYPAFGDRSSPGTTGLRGERGLTFPHHVHSFALR